MNVLNKCEDVLRRLFKVCGFFLTKKCSPKTNREEILEVDLQVFFNVLHQITKEPHHFPIFLDFYRMRVFLIFFFADAYCLFYPDKQRRTVEDLFANIIPMFSFYFNTPVFFSIVFFYTPFKHQKKKGFSMFSGTIERDLAPEHRKALE